MTVSCLAFFFGLALLVVPSCSQKPTQPHGLVHDYKTLAPCAEHYLPALAAFTNEQAAATGGHALNAPLKQHARSGEKMVQYLSTGLNEQTYSGGGGTAELTDLVRSSIVYPDYATLLAAIPKLKEAASNRHSVTVGGQTHKFFFCRVKNRFAHPNGEYMDFLNNICITWENIPAGTKRKCGPYHVGEMQLHIQPLIAAKEGGASFLGPWAPGMWARVLEGVEGAPTTPDKDGKPIWQNGHYYYELSRAEGATAATKEAAGADADKLYLVAQKLSGKPEDLQAVKQIVADDLQWGPSIVKRFLESDVAKSSEEDPIAVPTHKKVTREKPATKGYMKGSGPLNPRGPTGAWEGTSAQTVKPGKLKQIQEEQAQRVEAAHRRDFPAKK